MQDRGDADRARIWEVVREQPERAFDLTRLAAIEEYFPGETLLTIGQRNARSALAWARACIAQRGAALGLLRKGRMPFPFRQRDLADALGLSLVHTNKTLKALREDGLASWSNGELVVGDMDALLDAGEVTGAPGPPPPF